MDCNFRRFRVLFDHVTGNAAENFNFAHLLQEAT
jgi:hypothetical protein